MTASAHHASIATWLGVLFLLVMVQVLVGGYVRLSHSGLSLPGWPINGDHLLPPVTESGWQAMHELYLQELARLRQEIAAGAVGIRVLPGAPLLADFKASYLTEWTHRLLAAVAMLISLACMTTLLRHRELRRLVGPPLYAMVGLIMVQAIIGGILAVTGVATQVLFLHLGMATVILGLLLWIVLTLIRGEPTALADQVERARRPLRRLALIASALVLLQIVLGGLVGGSRHHGLSTSWPLMQGELVPTLWQSGLGWATNLIDNPMLHQFLHRWFAWPVVAVVLAVAVLARSAQTGNRTQLAIRFVTSTVCVQVVLGIMTVFSQGGTMIALAHLAMAMMLFAGLVMVVFDLYNEAPAPAAVSTEAGSPAGEFI